VKKVDVDSCLMWLLQTDQLEPGLRFLPIFYAATIVINLFSVFYHGPESEYINTDCLECRSATWLSQCEHSSGSNVILCLKVLVTN